MFGILICLAIQANPMQLVTQLDSAKFSERQRANRLLLDLEFDIGADAVCKGLRAQSCEVRQRCRYIWSEYCKRVQLLVGNLPSIDSLPEEYENQQQIINDYKLKVALKFPDANNKYIGPWATELWLENLLLTTERTKVLELLREMKLEQTMREMKRLEQMKVLND
jgi:hypothetical protein